MIWNDAKLFQWIRSGGITPADYDCVNPASVDLHIDRHFVDMLTGGTAGTIDVYVDGNYATTISRLNQLWYATSSKTAVVRGYDANGLVCG